MKRSITPKTFFFFLVTSVMTVGFSGVLAYGQAFAPAKVATINSNAFADPKIGVIRLVKVYGALETEFKPRTTELQQISAQIEKLAKEVQTANSTNSSAVPMSDADRVALTAKVDEGQRLQIDFKRKQEDAKSAYERRLNTLTEPILLDLMNSLGDYAKKRGIDIVIDLSKTEAVYILSPSADITAAFITEYNSKPATR